ncbi:MAG: hypothetical protein GEV07_26245 [Streptosporangiales bacterium]|nr:hypothetical protein [Streptosporangiales bacterium]
MRSRVSRTAVGVLSLVVVAVLAACGPVKMGAAAIVGDQRISAKEIDASARKVTELSPTATQQGNVPAGLTLSRVLDLLIREQAKREGIGYSQGDVDKAIAKATDNAGLRPGSVYKVPLVSGVQVQMPTADAREFAVSLYLQEQLVKRYAGADLRKGQQELAERLGALAEEIGVQVNPRYGDFDPRTVSLKVNYGGLWQPATGRAGQP